MARKYSDSTKANFDIYLPEWLAKYNKEIYTTIVVCLRLAYWFTDCFDKIYLNKMDEGGKDKEYSITIAMWDRVAQQYEGDIHGPGYVQCELWCVLQCSESFAYTKILEIGCGPGNIARYMLSKDRISN